MFVCVERHRKNERQSENVGHLFCRKRNQIPSFIKTYLLDMLERVLALLALWNKCKRCGIHLGRDFMIRNKNVSPESPPVEGHRKSTF